VDSAPRAYWLRAGNAASPSSTSPGTSPVTADFHTYGVSWQADVLRFYFDDREIQAYPTPPDMHAPMYLLANLAVGGPWAGAPDASTVFPAHLQIDHIRAWRQAG
jgi:beta-glucanase (GH16 family)